MNVIQRHRALSLLQLRDGPIKELLKDLLMYENTNFPPRGSGVVRALISNILAQKNAEGPVGALRIAEQRWGKGSEVAVITRAAVAGGSTASGAWGAELEAQSAVAEFLEIVTPMTILGRTANLRRVPVGVPVVKQTGAATGYWVAQGKATPLSSMAFDRTTLEAKMRVGAIVVVSNDLLEAPGGDEVLRGDLALAVASATDAAFIDHQNAGVAGEKPPGIAYGMPAIPASGSDAATFKVDIANALEAFTGSLMNAVWVMHPRAAAAIGLLMGAAGVACNLGARGGELAGLPVLTSELVEITTDGTAITLFDASSVLITEGTLIMGKNSDGAVEMDNEPTGDGTPTAATTLVPLWQTESTGLKVGRHIEWELGRPGAAVVITGVPFGAL
ncbi:phage major capsid protein [Polaromonas sp. JS666]|uniref:phage major capsid protein n=1 Tax=Polaromonas sp. (strain JS666 / ATCC BAA-500) TaxID=296591 RepID=UPI001E3F7AD0|nr:phage major capsid protein [Polaromonas sp. JS666]